MLSPKTKKKGRVYSMDYQNDSCIRIPRKAPLQLPYQVIEPAAPNPVKHEHYQKLDAVIDDGIQPYGKVRECPPPAPPNPIYPANATLPLLTPLAVTQAGNTILVTASIPAEAIITLPTEALEIKRITKKLKITQCRVFTPPAPILPGLPVDTPKLFIGGFVRKDIQYSKVKNQTLTTVEGEIRDFVVDVPVSGVVNLGTGIVLPTIQFDQDQEYEYSRRARLGTGFAEKERLLSPDFTEFNIVSNKILNRLPVCELVYSQINEMDDQLDRVSLCGGPFEEGTFRTLLEKMVVVVQIAITFPPSFLPVLGAREC
jgi:hypothetical protein